MRDTQHLLWIAAAIGISVSASWAVIQMRPNQPQRTGNSVRPGKTGQGGSPLRKGLSSKPYHKGAAVQRLTASSADRILQLLPGRPTGRIGISWQGSLVRSL